MTTENIQEQLEKVADAPFSMRIENNEMIITPAEAGVSLLAAISQMHVDEDEALLDIGILETTIEQLRDANAELRDLFEYIHPTLVELGQDALADKLMNILYPVSGVMDDGTVVEFGDSK